MKRIKRHILIVGTPVIALGMILGYLAFREPPAAPSGSRSWHVSVPHDDAIYVFGGTAPRRGDGVTIHWMTGKPATENLTSVLRFDPPDRLSVAWNHVGRMPDLGHRIEPVSGGFLILGRFLIPSDPSDSELPSAIMLPFGRWKRARVLDDTIPFRTWAGSVRVKDGILYTGGLDLTGKSTNSVFLIHDDLTVKELSTPPWSPRHGHSLVKLKDEVWLLAGLEAPGALAGVQSRLLDDVWRSRDMGHTWERMADAPWNRGEWHEIVSFDGRLWYFTTAKPGSLQAEWCEIWNSVDGSSWERVSTEAPWAGREGFSISVLDDSLYCIGGSAPGDVEPESGLSIYRSTDGIGWERVLVRPD